MIGLDWMRDTEWTMWFSRDNSMLPEELANQGVRLKEEQLRREEEKVNHVEGECVCVADDVDSFGRRN